MAKSQNGWSVLASASPRLKKFRWITGKVRYLRVYEVFDYLCTRFNAEVEQINVAWSWGYAARNVRGSSSTISNHASGTAIDLNAPAHPLGARGTFSDRQERAIRAILKDLDGVVRWGGDYKNRPDEMHFEIIGSDKELKAVVKKIREAAESESKPTPVLTISLKVLQQQAKAKKPVAKGSVRRYQKALNDKGGASLKTDGVWGPSTTSATKRWQKESGFRQTGVPGSGSLRALIKRQGRYKYAK